MTSFIEDVLIDLRNKNLNIPELIFVLPSKRAGTILRNKLPKYVEGVFFSPEILSIEQLVENISSLNYIDNIELYFDFYEVYLQHTPKSEIETFDKFYKWAQILIQDFNEIDRYLIDQNPLFDYLSAIKQIENKHWSLDEQQSDYIKNYLAFWKRIKTYYSSLKTKLLEKQKGYQGLVYRDAVDNLETFIQSNPQKKLVFMGFNALNTAEDTIIQELLKQKQALIYWDLDKTFYDNTFHEAGLFIRKHHTNWPYYKSNYFKWLHNNYKQPKTINAVGISKNIGQIKYVGSLLEQLKQDDKLNSTAVILGDESLLIPLLNSIPESIDAINITMGMPLTAVPLAALFEELFYIHKQNAKSFYHKDLVPILSNPFIRPLFNSEQENISDFIIRHIQSENIVNISISELKELSRDKSNVISLLFEEWDSPQKALTACSKLILAIKATMDKKKSKHILYLEYLYRFNEIFNSLDFIISKSIHINSLETLKSLYRELIKGETLDFQGEPLQGLQIMGMLESRVLDFETVIMISVNEGILPAGKSQNSFIPFDVKIENKLPTYKEKDAVYAYHFYRLLQRAKNVHLIYNTEPDVLNGGEPSRFITQLDIDKTHNINHTIITSKVSTTTSKHTRIDKTSDVMKQITAVAQKGFSPSSLTNYIRNPLDFYAQRILNVREFDDVEETIASNTLGTTVHNALEDLYKPFINQMLSVEILKKTKTKIEDTVEKYLKKEFKKGTVNKGKNLIIFEVAKRYVNNIIDMDINNLEQGHSISILALEKKSDITLNIPELNFPVKLIGTVDRVDTFDETLRIIDYKTGKVEPSNLKIIDWDDFTKDYKKYSKPFQVLTYAYMMNTEKPFSNPINAGIISLKNLNKGFMPFSENKNINIDQESLTVFYEQLKQLILEICNPDIPFIEKDI